MANKVTIDIEARFIDNVTNEAKAASKSITEVKKTAEETTKKVDDLGKKKVEPKVDANTTQAEKKVSKVDKILSKLGRKKTDTKLSATDKATSKIDKITRKLKALDKTHDILVKIKDSSVLKTLNSMSSGLKSLTGKTWSAVVKIKDTFTAPLTKLKNMLFNVKTLIAGIASAWAATQLVMKPINLADAYSSAKIGFSTILGEAGGQQMMNELDEFAKVTPFKTSGVIANAQKMMAMGWSTDTLIEDLEVIGNAAAATGKLDQGLESIVRALSQIKTKGKLSTEELNQLAEAGIAAKAMLAEGLGYGTGDEGIAKMTEELEDGKIASDRAIAALLEGMKKYDGMMDSMANETVEGLISQMQDAFEINVVRKWGQGLQDGAKKGFGTVIQLLDESEEALAEFGDMLYEIGKTASNWVADKLQGVVDKILEITGSFEFQNADLKGKVGMLWKGLVSDPLKEWWEESGRDSFIEAGGKFGTWLGESITKGVEFLSGGILSLLGLDDSGVGSDAGKIGREFWDNFTDAFDGEAIKDNIVEAISGVWNSLPWWAKTLLVGYGVGKTAGLVSNVAGGIAKFIGTAATAGAGDTIVAGTGLRGLIGGNVTNAAGDIIGASGLIGLVGSTGNAMVGGTGVLGKLASAGYALTGGPASAGAYFGAGMSGAAAAGVGALGIGGGIAAGASLIKGGIDLYKGFTAEDETDAKAYQASGSAAIGGVAAGAIAGAAIGSIVPVIGTALGGLIGAGVGGIAGWIGGDKWANNIRAAKYESEEMQEAIKDSEKSAEELAEIFAKAKWENAKKHFGDIKLSMAEIERLADQIIWGDDMGYYENFTASVQAAETALQSMKTATEQADRWMWKASLGVKFNEDEIENIKKSFDDYINSAKTFVENKHYEFAAAVSLFVDVESEEGKSIIDSGNAFYGSLQEQLNDLGGKLTESVNIALEDGVITLDEEQEIINLQKQIASITEKIANAEQQAELNLIKVKFGKGKLDYDSFDPFMEQMQATIDERMKASDEAFIASVSSLNLQLEEGAINQEQYDQQLQTIIAGYTGTVEGLQAQVKNVELQIIGEAYSDVLGKDAVNDLEKVLQYSIDNELDPVEISNEDLFKILNVSSLSTETAANLKEMLSGTLSQLKLLEIDGDLLLKVGEVQTEEGTEEKVKQAAEGSVPDSLDKEVDLNLTGKPNIQNQIEILASEFGIEETEAQSILWQLTADKNILNQVEILCTEFGINETEAQTVLWKLTGTKNVLNPFTLTSSEFGIKSSYTFNPSVNINPTVTTSAKSFTLQLLEGQGYRGGIFGGDSAMDAFARGGRTDNGIVGGSTRFIRVNEESPEMIIPLSSQRRERALKLWTKTGEILGVPGFARGGTIGTDSGSQDEGFRFRGYERDEAAGGQSVQVDVGGVKVEIHVDATNTENIAEAIRAQSGEIADTLAGIMADALGGQFENTPVRGGAA